MHTIHRPLQRVGSAVIALSAVVCATALVAAPQDSAQSAAASSSKTYTVHNLVSDGFVPADHTDADLVNGWGIAASPTSPTWVADNGTGKSTIYDGNGTKLGLVVTIPPPPSGTPPSAPTGMVASTGNDFVVTKGTVSGASRFIWATENGTIAGWSPAVDATNAIIAVDNSASGAIYKGLALSGTGAGRFLYATDFHHNRVAVFDGSFHPVTTAGGFVDPKLPNHYAPFGIQNILGNLYVTYAKQDDDAEDDVKGEGFGFVSVFDANGNFIRRFASRGTLNAPWGVALAPADFGKFSNALLVGNFGDGRINAYDLASREFLGQLKKGPGDFVEIDGLWGIAFGNGVASQRTNWLFFAAGPGDEAHGLYGRIEAVAGS